MPTDASLGIDGAMTVELQLYLSEVENYPHLWLNAVHPAFERFKKLYERLWLDARDYSVS